MHHAPPSFSMKPLIHEIRQGVDMAAIPIRAFEVLGMHTKSERDKVGRAEIISGNPLQDRAD